MSEKTCTKCGAIKPFAAFKADPRYRDGYTGWCLDCHSAYSRAYSEANKEKKRQQERARYAGRKEESAARGREWYVANKVRKVARARATREADRPKYRERARLASAKARQSIGFRLRARISKQFLYCLGTGKGGATTVALLGYSIEDLRKHLERQFVKGMGWDNMGKWHIDHIVPLSSFTITGPDDPELRRAWGLPNLRPLWATDNFVKHAKRVTLL